MKLYTSKEVASILKMNEQVIAIYLREGKLRGFRVGRRWRIEEEDLQDFIRNAKLDDEQDELLLQKNKL